MGNVKKDLDIKLIALDMDGTLLNNNGQVSSANRDAIRAAQEKGVYVVLSTGRSLLTVREHADDLELTSYLVTVNGSEIWDEKRELVERNIVNPEHIQWMWDLSKQHNSKFWAINTEQTWHNEMPEDLHKLNWLKFGFTIEDDATRELVLKELTARGEFEITNSTLKNIEVNAAGIHKARGLSVVCSKIGIDMQNVMACGDSRNDLMMIKEAGLGVAMGNAQDVVKAAADWITASNEEDGVAKAIQKWVLD
ncbi:Cof-type HAD-IIB family hydrolase [Neobacillus cucumis]|uniref:Cof-type HAD-IIB family hydrolase n=1 Tax=Neobacillus cucumis TaxID=1740721 RepID=UPI0019666835|nr:Cof-type HAD-IIB family hydrolase [Neobacillus cucumis]MBM7652966.1 HAD superfamily hydrolase (TIGR01484 family) [Neobacillus cucumis]MED4229294.1 Cof-type HAD-IIB family hydrolase [Neobacillus cucumis]